MAVNKLSVLEAGFPEDAALMEVSFFEDLHRCRVIIVNMAWIRTMLELFR